MFILSLLIILIAVGLGRILSRAIKQPVILGEIILGMILGNLGYLVLVGPIPQLVDIQSLQSLIFTGDDLKIMSHLADIGIILLLFSTGLAINFEEFKRLEIASSVVASLGVIFPFLLGYLVAIFFGFSTIIALYLGISLVATSVGVNASILTELKMLRTRLGTLIMGAAVVDDVIGVVMISALVGIVVTGTIPLARISLLVVFVVLFFLIALTLGIKGFRKFSEKIHLGKESVLLLGLIVVLLFGLITEEIGLASIVGAFVAGLVVGQSRLAAEVREHVSLIGGAFFIPIFFVFMGTKFDVRAFLTIGLFAVVLLIVAIIGKIVGCGGGAKISKFSGRESFAVGIAMIPRAGVELILLKFALDYKIIGSNIASAILIMIIVTTLITPPLLVKALKMIRKEKKENEKV
ncbi:MAG: cation:proton antiporter [Candidatus Thermoplasmatota archaeon]|nr:cation:proton antiporter [Candidatus Thermoplasmatota archaeon]